MVTVDAVVFRPSGTGFEVLLIKRKNEPFKDMWALPGGFVDMDESLEAAVARELEEETGITGIVLTQFHAFGNPGRDPRGRNISVVYYGMADYAAKASAGDDAADARWHSTRTLPPLGFDHREVISMAMEKLPATK
ncbi:MAG: NUDIX hydrolase [bacterium]